MPLADDPIRGPDHPKLRLVCGAYPGGGRNVHGCSAETERLDGAGMAAYAVGAWMVTVLAAGLVEQSGRSRTLFHRGPAEVLLRRLTYGPRDDAGQPKRPVM